MGGEVPRSQHGMAAKQVESLFSLANDHMDVTFPASSTDASIGLVTSETGQGFYL